MSRRLLLLGLSMLLGVLPASAQAQPAGFLISPTEANRFGLERIWFTRIQFDRARGRIAHVRQHVSSKYGYTVHEVISARGRTVITDRDLDLLGIPLGKAGAEKEAQRIHQQLTRSGITAELKTQVLPEISLYVVSDSGVVQAIDGETGRTRWSATIGNPDYPTEAPGINDDYVVIINGSSIYLLDQATGSIVWRRRAVGAPGAGAGVSDNLVFAPMVGGTLEGYSVANPRQPPWIYKGHGRAVVQPMVAGSSVAWPTDKGHLYVAEAHLTGIRYRLETNRPILAPATALPPNRIVVVSTDGYVYCIHESSGGLQWRFSTGEPIVKPVVTADDAIYVVTDEDNLFRLSTESGLEQWWSPRIREVITASKERVYCLDDTGRLVIFDSKTGGRIGSLSTELLDVRLVNYHTDRIILGSATGVIQCLREVAAEWPTIRSTALESKPKETARPVKPAAEPTEDEAAPPPTTADPFGAESDPFGSPSTMPAAESDDPFGSGSF